MSPNRIRLAAWAALALLVAAPALAEKKIVRLPEGPEITGYDHFVRIGPGYTGGSFCELGGLQQPFDEIDLFLIPNDQYYTLLDPATCNECGATGTMTVDRIHVAINFRTACTQPILISILESDANGCPRPDLNKVLMAPTQFDLTGPGPGVTMFELNLANPVCLRGKAFLGLTVNQYGATCAEEGVNTPTLVYGDTVECAPCRAYNYYPDPDAPNGMFIDAFCNGPNDLTPGLPIHYVSGSCCKLMPTLPATWGQVRSRYRPRRVTPRARRRRFRARSRT